MPDSQNDEEYQTETVDVVLEAMARPALATFLSAEDFKAWLQQHEDNGQ